MIADRIVIPGTDLQVSRLCLGGNRLGGELGRDESFALLDAFVQGGGNFIDTAHVYADWIAGNERSSSEKTLGRWLASRRPQGIVIATKGGHPPLDQPAQSRLDAASLRRDVEESLANLGVDALDLLYVHRDDPGRPAAEILGALESLRVEGLIRCYGASNWTAARLAEAEAAAAREGWRGFVANQAEWNLARRNPETIPADLAVMDAAMLRHHRRSGLAAIPYSAQAKGYFDGPAETRSAAALRLYDNAASRAVALRLGVLAAKVGATPTQVMLAAMLRAPFPVIPVIGCRTPTQVTSSLGSLAIALEGDEAEALLAIAG